MKKVIDVPAGHTVTIRQEGGQIVIESKLVSEQGDEFITEDALDFGTVRVGDILIVGDLYMFISAVRSAGWSLTCVSYNPAMPGLGKFDVKTDEGTTFHKLARKATEAEKQQLFDALRDKYALMWDGKELVNWRANPDGTYFFLAGCARFMPVRETCKRSDEEFYTTGNYFPADFLTAERVAEFREVTSKLFASWRK